MFANIGLQTTWPRGCFLKASETFRARKAIFTSPVSENGEVYTPEISFVKRTSVYVKNMRIKQLCNHKLREFAMAFRVRKLIGTFEKRASGPVQTPLHSCAEPNLIKFDLDHVYFVHPSTEKSVDISVDISTDISVEC